METILVKNMWYKVLDKILVGGYTKYLCESKDNGSISIIDPSEIEVVNG